jgi:hypothetical protein
MHPLHFTPQKHYYFYVSGSITFLYSPHPVQYTQSSGPHASVGPKKKNWLSDKQYMHYFFHFLITRMVAFQRISEWTK